MEVIDENYIWQRRIHHGARNQKGEVPFPESVEVGLEFNAALERKEKLDLCLLTNSVMLEISHFARTVTKSQMFFLFDMLDFNFDLSVDPDNQTLRYVYASRVYNKTKLLKEQLKVRPQRWKEVFALPDVRSLMETAGTGLYGRHFRKRNHASDSSVLTDSSRNCRSPDNQTAKSNEAASRTLVGKKTGMKPRAGAYSICRDLGLTLAVQPNCLKQKLEPNLITIGVMMELLHFSKVFCGGYIQIVEDLVKQNFGHELDRSKIRLQISKLMERKYASISEESKEAFRKEPFSLQTTTWEPKRNKRKELEADHQESITMDKKRRVMPRHTNRDVKDVGQDSDLSYTCPLDFETGIQSGTEAGQETTPLFVKQEEEEAFVSPGEPWTKGHDTQSFNLNPPQHTVSDLLSEDKNQDRSVMTPKQRLWVRRASRSKQIQKCRVTNKFARCRDAGLDFNVGSGNKQNLDLHLLTNCVLLEVCKFATAMTKSLYNYLFDILNKNFNLVLQDQQHKLKLLSYLITKEKNLQNHPDRKKVEFLSSTFTLPEVYNMVDVTGDVKAGDEVETEQQTNCDSSACNTSEQADAELYPFCTKSGLDLWSSDRRPASNKLDLSVLTIGAVLEIFLFVRKLCGVVHEMVNDVLEHNFNLDLQSGETKAAQVIQRWHITHRYIAKKLKASPTMHPWLNIVVFSPQPQNGASPADEVTAGLKLCRDTFNSKVQNVKMVNSYHICKEIGLDLNVGPKSEVKTKLDLRVLTRGALLEVHQYVEQNCMRYVPSLYQILDYNFDLSFQNHRKVEFAWSIASQAIAMSGKTSRKENYLNRVFELPFDVPESSAIACKEEPEDGYHGPDPGDDDIMFVRELKPVDIEVMIE